MLLLSPFATTIVLSEGLGKNLAFATNQGDDSVSVISLVDFQVIKNIKVGKAPAGIAIDNINGQVFVSNAEDKSISVIKINELKTIKTIKITGSAVGVEISRNGDYIYVADWFNNSLLVYSNLKFKLLKSIRVGRAPAGVVSGKNGLIYVANRDDNTISVISEKSFEIVETFIFSAP